MDLAVGESRMGRLLLHRLRQAAMRWPFTLREGRSQVFQAACEPVVFLLSCRRLRLPHRRTDAFSVTNRLVQWSPGEAPCCPRPDPVSFLVPLGNERGRQTSPWSGTGQAPGHLVTSQSEASDGATPATPWRGFVPRPPNPLWHASSLFFPILFFSSKPNVHVQCR